MGKQMTTEIATLAWQKMDKHMARDPRVAPVLDSLLKSRS